MECPICEKPGLMKNEHMKAHYLDTHKAPGEVKFYVSLVIIVITALLSLIVNIIRLDSADTRENDIELWFGDQTVLANIDFYFNKDHGNLNFTFNNMGANVSHFTVILPQNLQKTGFSIIDNSGNVREEYHCSEQRGGSGLEDEVVYHFTVGRDENLPTNDTRSVSINFTGQLEPEGTLIFYTECNRTGSQKPSIEMIFENRKCAYDCVTVLSGPYTYFPTYQKEGILRIASNGRFASGSTEPVIMIINTEETSFTLKDLANIILPIIAGFMITFVWSTDWINKFWKRGK